MDLENEDLIFYLFVRSCIEKELKMLFIEKAKDDTKLYNIENDNTEVNLKTTSPNIITSYPSQPTLQTQHNQVLHTQHMETEIFLSVKQCINVVNSVFGKEEENLLNSFMNKIEIILANKNKMEGNGRHVVSAYDVMYITLQDYHNNRVNFVGGEALKSDDSEVKKKVKQHC